MGKFFEDVKSWYQAVDTERCQDFTCERLKANKNILNIQILQAEFKTQFCIIMCF